MNYNDKRKKDETKKGRINWSKKQRRGICGKKKKDKERKEIDRMKIENKKKKKRKKRRILVYKKKREVIRKETKILRKKEKKKEKRKKKRTGRFQNEKTAKEILSSFSFQNVFPFDNVFFFFL